MLPDRVSNPGPLTYESGALPIALRGPAPTGKVKIQERLKALKIPNFRNKCLKKIRNVFVLTVMFFFYN